MGMSRKDGSGKSGEQGIGREGGREGVLSRTGGEEQDIPLHIQVDKPVCMTGILLVYLMANYTVLGDITERFASYFSCNSMETQAPLISDTFTVTFHTKNIDLTNETQMEKTLPYSTSHRSCIPYHILLYRQLINHVIPQEASQYGARCAPLPYQASIRHQPSSVGYRRPDVQPSESLIGMPNRQ